MMKSTSRLKPIAPRPESNFSQGPNPNAFAGAHLGVAASSLEGSVSMNPLDYVWGTPTALPGACSYSHFTAGGYVCAPGPAVYGQQHLIHHSVSLPNLYPPAEQQQGCVMAVPVNPVCSSGEMEEMGTGQGIGGGAMGVAQELSNLDDVLAMPLDDTNLNEDTLTDLKEFLDDNDMGPLDVENAEVTPRESDTNMGGCDPVLMADDWRVGSCDPTSDHSTGTGEVKMSCGFHMLGDDCQDGGPLGATSGNLLETSEGPDEPTLSTRSGLNLDTLDFLDSLPDLDEASSELASAPPRSPVRFMKKAPGNLKRTKSEIVLKRAPRPPNVLKSLPRRDALCTILDFLNAPDHFPLSERQTAIRAIRAMQRSLEQGPAASRLSAVPGPMYHDGPFLQRAVTDKIPKGPRSRNRGSPSKTSLGRCPSKTQLTVPPCDVGPAHAT